MRYAGKLVRSFMTVSGIMLIAFAIVFSMAASAQDQPKVVDPNGVAYGRTYAQWSAAWNQWADSIPVAQHPLFDNGDCTISQSGPVWFLGGKFCANGSNCSYSAVRSCTVPAGKALFFPIEDYEDSALEENISTHPGDPAYQQIATLRTATSTIEGATDIFCRIDRVPVPHLQRFGVHSEAFGFTLPSDNLFAAIYPAPNNYYMEGAYFPAVDFGYYVMVPPLPPGNHVIRFGASWLDITYHLTVK